jgi:hypothetical protein
METLSTEEMTALRGGHHTSHGFQRIHKRKGAFTHKFSTGNGIANNSGGIGNNSGGISNSFNTVTVIPQGGEIDFEL